jgi:hypothetical protein
MTLCVVCTVHKETRSTGFLVEPQNQGQTRFSLKITRTVYHWPQNYWDNFSWFSLKTGCDSFFWFDLKIGGGGFLGLGLKIVSYGLVICVSKSPRLFFGLGLKIKRDTVAL